MQIYPAIDIKGGRVARVLEGDRARETVYGNDPVAQARQFVRDGADWVHVVDMDRAFRTGRDNRAVVQRIAALAGVKVQLGGNVDSVAGVRDAVALGASRIVLGMPAELSDAFDDLLRAAGRTECALAVNTRAGRVAPWGTSQTPADTVDEIIEFALDRGVGTIVYRDVERDGMVHGADIDGAARAARTGATVIVAGGVAGLEDIRAARNMGLSGVIVGRALYEGRFTLQEALRCSS